ncbi:MAG: universal stress protein [Puia sp.]|nr:universal stress protein [Puia sp.]
MKKIIAAFDGLRFSQDTLEEAIDLSRHHDAHLVGVFLPEFVHAGFVVFETVETLSYAGGREQVERLHRQDAAVLKESIARFEKACQGAGLQHTVHSEKDFALKALLHESVFADLLLIDRRETFSSLEEKVPGAFLKSLLHDLACPAWIIAKKTVPVSKMIFLYDGGVPSAYAMKMFTYLFPDMTHKDVEVLSFTMDTQNLHVPDHRLVHEWMKRHYPHALFKVVPGGRAELLALLREEGPGTVVITGSYARSRWSNWLLPSLSDELMQESKTPVFIAHT